VENRWIIDQRERCWSRVRLKFRVISQSGDGLLYGVSHVQRINTRGSVAQGACDKAGSLLSVPYSADYLSWHAD
jgi:hypothetical protein